MEDLTVRIKAAANDLIEYELSREFLPDTRRSAFISNRVGMPFAALSRHFSKSCGLPIREYLVALRIDRAKALITEHRYPTWRIAQMLGYSSRQYMSNQFKKTTGLTISQFREAAFNAC